MSDQSSSTANAAFIAAPSEDVRDVGPLRTSARDSEKVRLAIVMGSHWAAQIGGAQYQVKCLLEALTSRPDFEIDYVTRVAPDEFAPRGYRIVKIDGGRRRGALRFLRDLPKLYRTLVELRPSVVYQRALQPYTGACALYCARYNARFVFHVAHEYDVQRPNAAEWPARTFAIRWLERRIAEYGMRRAHSIVVQTNDQARMLEAGYGLKAKIVVPNFHPEPADLEPRAERERLRVVWVANFKPFKNPQIFVDLAEALAGNPGIEFVMIGRPGEAERFTALHERIRRLPNLDYLGELSIDEVNDEISRSDVFVNTSAAEGFPNTFIQAWLRGVPVVSYKVDPDRCLSKGGGGILAGSEERLVSILADLASDRERLRKLGEAAREYGRSNHTPKQAEKLVRLLAESAPA